MRAKRPAPPAPRKSRQGVERRLRRAEMIDQPAESGRPRYSWRKRQKTASPFASGTIAGMEHKPALYALIKLHAELGYRINAERD